MADHLLKEDGGGLLLEDDSGLLLLEQQSVAPTGEGFLLQEDGFKFALEDGSGFILLEAASTVVTPIGGSIIIPRRRLVTRLRQEGFEEDEAIALSLLLRTRRRLR